MIDSLTHNTDSKIMQYWNDSSIPYTDGIDVECSHCFNIAEGTVLFIGTADGIHYEVAIICNDNELIRYCNLTEIDVYTGQLVKTSKLIGTCDKFVHFEYCTKWKGNSKFTLRIQGLRFYKQNPLEILEGDYAISSYIQLIEDEPRLGYTDYTEFQKTEFGQQRVVSNYV